MALKTERWVTTMNDLQNDLRAVLTGDIINSSILDQQERQRLFEVFPALSAILRERYPQEISYNMSNFRGDGWQLVINHPHKSLEISLFIRAYLRFAFTEKKIDSRIAIGVGMVDFIPAGNISAGYGSAYTVSGHLLEVLKAYQRMGIAFSTEAPLPTTSTAVILVELIDTIITSWGPSQCQAVFWALQGLTQTQIADRWLPEPITQPSVSNNINRAGWASIKKTLVFFEEMFNNY